MSDVTTTVSADITSINIAKDDKGNFIVTGVNLNVPNSDGAMSGNLYKSNLTIASTTKTKLTAFIDALKTDL